MSNGKVFAMPMPFRGISEKAIEHLKNNFPRHQFIALFAKNSNG